MRFLSGKQGGFSLIELVVAFAMLLIVSGALLNMFVVSTRLNNRGAEYDEANMVLNTVVESFKATPSTYSTLSSIESFEFNENGKIYTAIVEVTTSSAVEAPNIDINPVFTYILEDYVSDYDMSFNNGINHYLMSVVEDKDVFNPVDVEFDDEAGDKVENVIPVLIKTQDLVSDTKNINVANNTTDKSVKLYVTTNSALEINYTVLNGEVTISNEWEADDFYIENNQLYILDVTIENGTGDEIIKGTAQAYEN